MSGIDKMSDDTYLGVTEALALAGDAMAKGDTETLLVVTLSSDAQSAILGGAITTEGLAALQGLLADLVARAEAEGPGDHVLHVWR